MDLQSFIQSGLLEAYVAGQCDAAERQQVEQMAAQYPEVRAELANIEQALEKFALANAIAPPAGLKNNILDHIDKLPDMSPSNTSQSGANGKSTLRATQLAAIVFALAAGYFFWQTRAIKADNAALKTKAETALQQLEDCTKRQERTDPMATLLRDADTQPIKLTDGKTYNITIFNNKLRKECALDLSGIPVPPDGKYLQCWALVNGNPVSLGMVQMNAIAGWQPLPYTENAQVYAISEEKNPQGNPKPTIIIALGNIPG